MTRRSVLGFLLILSSSELSRTAPRGVFAAGEGGASSFDYPLSSYSSSFSPSSLQRKTDLNVPAALRSHGPAPPEADKTSVRTPNGTPEDRWSDEDLSARVARAKRRTIRHDEDTAYLGSSKVPSDDENLVRPDDVLNLELPYGDSFSSRNRMVDRRGYDADGETPADGAQRGGIGSEDRKRSLRDPGLFLIARLRTDGRLFPDVKRKWKSKNMAMWGR